MGADREPFFPEWGVGMAKHSHFLYCYSPRSSFALRASALGFSLNTRMGCPARSLNGWGERSLFLNANPYQGTCSPWGLQSM